jgi:hypothetical protein
MMILLNIFFYFAFGIFLTIFLDKINLLTDIIGNVRTKNVLFFLSIYPLILMVHTFLFMLASVSNFFDFLEKRGK